MTWWQTIQSGQLRALRKLCGEEACREVRLFSFVVLLVDQKIFERRAAR